MKRVLITGGAGFIAHHIVKLILQQTDWEIVTLDRLDCSGNLNRLYEMLQFLPSDQTKRCKIVYHDLKAPINSLVASRIGQVEYILHLAAGSHVDRSIEYPMEFVLDNVVGTCNILDFARTQAALERFIYFSTDEVFGPAPEGVRYKEWDRYNSTNPYSASKAGGEELALAYRNTYRLPIQITHTMNVFGERQHPEKFIPSTIAKVRDGKIVTIHSNAEKTKAGSRFYIHADDVADAIHFILIRPEKLGIKFNIVGYQELDNLELAQLIAKIQNKPLLCEMVDFHSSRPGHDLRYALSGDYMAELGWRPQLSVSQRLTQVVNWSLAHPEWLL